MIFSAGPGGSCEHVNPAWLAFTGRTLEEELGDGWRASVHPDDREPYLALCLAKRARREPFEARLRLRRHDGAYRAVLLRGAPRDGPEGPAGYVWSGLDVEALAGDDAFGHAEFFEMSLDHLCVAGFDGYWKRLNPSWTKTLGWTPREMMSCPLIEFVHPDDREATLAGRRGLREGVPVDAFRNRYRCKDGSYRWFEWKSVASDDRMLVYAIARDVTEEMEARERHKELQQQLMIADRMASVGTLAAGAAHEINNPLAYVMVNLELIAEELRAMEAAAASERLAECVEMIHEAREGAERIRNIVGGLKTFSRADEERRAVVALQPILQRAISLVHNEIRHRARLSTDFGGTPPVEADDSRLGQVFINLLVNAMQAIPEGETDAHEIRVATSTDADGCAVVEIHDTGPGIAPEVIDRIFDPFFTTKPVGVGTGLGLSICHNAVHGWGGQLSARNRQGGGATFRLTLPPGGGAVRGDAPAAISSEAAARRRAAAVLVVDDEPAIGVSLRRVLRDHDVTLMTEASDALELVLSGKHFDVILSDLMMPGMSGMEFYEELQRHRPRAAERVAFITGGAFTTAAQAFLDRVSNPRFDKPFDPPAIRALVERAVG